jgi:Na+/melibiose symporter-like transporter
MLNPASPVPRLEPKGLSRVEAGPSGSHAFQGGRMLVSALITFLVVILILYLINLLPIDGRAKQIARVVVIILGVISLLKYIAVF